MRLSRSGFLALAVLLLVPQPKVRVLADDETGGKQSPIEKPAKEMTEEERAEALARAEELGDRVVTLFQQGKYGEAVLVAGEALEVSEALLGPDHPDVAANLSNLATLYKVQGAYDAARPLYERALEILEKALDPDHPDLATSLGNLASLRDDQGAHAEARPLYERALKIREKALGPDHPDVAADLNGLALLLQAQGAYAEARPLYERALEINVKALGADHPKVATNLNNLGLLHFARGAYAEARLLYEQALEIYVNVLGPDHPLVATSLNNLALLLCTQGAYAEARPLYERALELHLNAHGPNHPSVATSLGNLASLLFTVGAYDAAKSLYERALEIHEEAHGPDHPWVATGLGNLAGLLYAQGAYDEAKPLLVRALRIDEKTYGPDHPSVANSLCNLAEVLEVKGAYDEARPLYERALRIDKEAYGPDHPSVAMSLRDLAGLLMATGHHELARPLLGECLDICAGNVRRYFSGLQMPQRRALLASLRAYLDDWLRLAPKVDASGYPEVLRFKGLVARATAAERMLTRRSGSDVAGRVTSLRVAEQRLSELANSMPPMFQKRKRVEWREAYARAGAEREKLALDLARQFAPLRQGLERLDLLLKDVQTRLDPDAVLVDFLRSGARYLAWIVRPEGEVERLDLGDAEAIEKAASEFTELAANDEAKPADDAWIRSGRTLHDLVVAPISLRIGSQVRTVYLCPDAAIAAVPFAALPGQEKGRYLIDDYGIVQVSMAQDLVPWPDAPTPGTGAVAVGDVNYASASEKTELPVEPSPTGIAAVDRAPRGSEFGPLPETRTEVEFVRSRLGEACRALLGQDATEARFRAEAKGKRILHLATHGFVRSDLLRGLHRLKKDEHAWLGADMERQLAAGHDPMNLAGLAMAGANPREGGHGDDGILTAAEASLIDLDGVELVVLSACQTALGQAESGEGVIGLVQGLQMAGAGRVIASLWQVDDEATRLLMQHLYEGMLRAKDPLSPAEALREAALAVRGSVGVGGRSFAAPRFWAGFVCYSR